MGSKRKWQVEALGELEPVASCSTYQSQINSRNGRQMASRILISAQSDLGKTKKIGISLIYLSKLILECIKTVSGA
jgi:hypothetical protein